MAEKHYRKASVSFPDDVLEAGRVFADKNRYSFSGYVSRTVEQDLRARGYLGSEDENTDLSDALEEAVTAKGAAEVLAALQAMLRKEAGDE